MAHVYADRVMETSVTTGTGPMVLTGALTGFRTFASVLTGGDTIDYAIQAVDDNGVPTGAWETGRGTYSAPGQLTRSTLHASSTGAFIDWAAGTKQVMLTQTAQSVRTLVKEAPADGNLYVRKDASWTPIDLEPVGSGGAGKHRYWRLQAASGAPAWNIQLQELVLTNTFDGLQKAVGGTALASAGTAALAFDANTATRWSGGEGGGWIGYDFGAPIQIVEARIVVSGGPSNWGRPTTGNIQFSDDGVTWISAFPVNTGWGGGTLPAGDQTGVFRDATYVPPYETRVPAGGTTGQVLTKTSNLSGETAWRTPLNEAPADGKLYVRKDAGWTPVALEGAQNTTPYGKRTQWRIRTTAVAGGSARYCVVAELSFRGPDGQPIPATGGAATGTTGDAGREPAKAFDGNPATSYASTPSIAGSPGGIALGYSFPAPVEVGAVTVQVGSNLQDTPTAFTVEYYDGAAWVPAWSVTKTWTAAEVATFTTPHLIPPYNTKVPAGGTPGQVLAKSSAANGDTTWINPPQPAIVALTQAAYDALPAVDPNTLYVIIG